MKNICYFGHHKCATNWMRRLFKDVCQEKQWNYKVFGGARNNLDFEEATHTISMFVSASPRNIDTAKTPFRGFHLIRDPRDAMVSGYWSWKVSHSNNTPEILEVREKLQQLSLEDGLLAMLDHVPMLKQLESWEFDKYQNILEVKYENLLKNQQEQFQKIFEYLEINLDQAKLSKLIEQHSFQSITKRKPGEELVSSHFRKGISGDWQNYFTDKIKNAFKDRYGYMLMNLEYEQDMNW